MSSSFRFNSAPGAALDNTARRLKKRNSRSAVDPAYLAADTSSLTNAFGRWPIDAYAELAEHAGITLTRKEADLIALANPGVRPPQALESLYPWLPSQNYANDSGRNFQNLLSVIRRFGHLLVPPTDYCDEKWNKVCNSVRMTTDLDVRFYSAWHLPVQDAYILEETRPNRNVIAIDFNGMYPSCMQHKFPKPSKLSLVSYHRDVQSGEALPVGLFRCTLFGPASEFILKYNPFRTFFSGRYLRASIEKPIAVDLNEFEVAFYQRHFGRVYIADAILSNDCITHPLARDARRSFSRRFHYLAQNNRALANREKFLSTLMTSCTQRPKKIRLRFASDDFAEKYLRDNFGIAVAFSDLESPSERWLKGRKGLTVSNSTEGIHCRLPNLQDGSACFVFNQRIVARSRIVLLEMMQKVSKIAPDVEICYANIDSIHFSLPSQYLDTVLEKLRRESSDKMGGYKIEAVSRSGLWLEPGRYWLYSDDIVKFRNRSIGSRGDAFTDHAVHVVSRKIGDLHIPIRMNVGMESSMSDTRSIVRDLSMGLERQRLLEIDNSSYSSDILRKLEYNRVHGISRRMRAFRRLAEVHESRRDLLPQDPTA